MWHVRYRADIQVLRGVAVLLVVLFHLDLAGVKSGFLGVDVFFVISGFLMALLYDPHAKTEFFKRRIRRLLPLYFFVVFVTVAVSIFVVTPNEYRQVAQQSWYALAFASNIGFWMQNSYFSKADFNPLLHLWSLGVEIQFYLLVPLFSWFFRRHFFWWVAVFVLSLTACFVVVGISPKTSFFITPFRLWEFLAGYGIAAYVSDKGEVRWERYRWLGATGGVILIAIPLLPVDGEALGFVRGHPGLGAFGVVLATTFVLAFGLPSFWMRSFFARVLERIGTYSYSIYLVHFPLIVLVLYEPFSGTRLYAESLWQTLGLVFAIAALSYVTYRFVEEPLRKIRGIETKVFWAVPLIAAAVYAGYGIQKYMYDEKEQKAFAAWEDRAPYRCGKLVRILHPSEKTCRLSPSPDKEIKRYFLVGNSHADALKKIFAETAAKEGVSVYFTVSNIPLMRGSRLDAQTVVAEAKRKKIDRIVLHYSPGAIDVKTVEKLVALARNEGIGVDYILPVPVWNVHIPKAIYEHLRYGTSLPKQSLDEYRRRHRHFIEALRHIEGLRVYRTDPYLCRDGMCRFADENDTPYYFDDGHLTLTGAKVLAPLFTKIVSQRD